MSDILASRTKIYAAIGELTLAAGAIDNQMAIILARLMYDRQDTLSMGFPSIFIFSARSFEQRQEIILKAFELRCAPFFNLRKQDNRRRAAEFTRKMMKIALGNISAHKWQRNLAAHGAVEAQDDEVRLVPVMMDMIARDRLAERGEAFKEGLTATQVDDATKTIKFDADCLGRLAQCLWSLLDWKESPAEFLQRANVLARDLKQPTISLRDPREGPPMRQSKKNRGARPPGK